MRGSPLLRAAIALLFLLLLGLPLRKLLVADDSSNEGTPIAAAPLATNAAQLETVHLQVDFTLPPERFRLLSLGEEIWNEQSPGESISRDLTLAYPKEGIELDAEVEWPEGSRAAARLTLRDPDGSEHVRTIWGEGKTSEVLTFIKGSK